MYDWCNTYELATVVREGGKYWCLTLVCAHKHALLLLQREKKGGILKAIYTRKWGKSTTRMHNALNRFPLCRISGEQPSIHFILAYTIYKTYENPNDLNYKLRSAKHQAVVVHVNALTHLSFFLDNEGGKGGKTTTLLQWTPKALFLTCSVSCL